MKVLTQKEVAQVSGGEAGVDHSDYYYGDNSYTWTLDNMVDVFLDWFERAQ
jgi:hypothetical protein